MPDFGIIAGVISAVAGVAGAASTIFGGDPKMPTAANPAKPARNPRLDTGASVALGTASDIQDQRVSGARAVAASNKSVDVLGGLGAGSGIRV